MFDVLFATLALTLLAPVFLLLAAWVKAASPGPVFFTQERIGENGQAFRIFKFRSMVQDAESLKKNLHKHSHRDGPLFKVKNDPRITNVGKFLRRFSLDELPQLANILLGQMSLTGPRPHLREEIAKFSPQEKRILQVKPGLSGLAQISGRSDLPFAKEIELDLAFIRDWHFALDLKIIFKSIQVVLRGAGAD